MSIPRMRRGARNEVRRSRCWRPRGLTSCADDRPAPKAAASVGQRHRLGLSGARGDRAARPQRPARRGAHRPPAGTAWCFAVQLGGAQGQGARTHGCSRRRGRSGSGRLALRAAATTSARSLVPARHDTARAVHAFDVPRHARRRMCAIDGAAVLKLQGCISVRHTRRRTRTSAARSTTSSTSVVAFALAVDPADTRRDDGAHQLVTLLPVAHVDSAHINEALQLDRETALSHLRARLLPSS